MSDAQNAGSPAGELQDLTAIVTGGASGIGLATSLLLASRGARVAVLNLNAEGLPEGLTGFAADVTSRGRGVLVAFDGSNGPDRFLERLDALINYFLGYPHV